MAKSMPHTSSLPKPNPWSVLKVLQQLPHAPSPEGSSSPIPFFHYVERLKIEKREGWKRFGISRGESIADHMYRMSILTMLAPPSLSSKLDIPKCTKMALVHDLAEGLVGDLTPMDGVPKSEKNRREATTFDWISSSLLGNVYGGRAGLDLKAAWQEYEDSVTLESLFVHDVDKVELLLQMVEYERANDCAIDLSELCNVAKRVVLPEMKEWTQQILDEREHLWRSRQREPRMEITDVVKTQQDEYYGPNNGTSDSQVNGHV